MDTITIHEKYYDLHNFKHPGGEEIIYIQQIYDIDNLRCPFYRLITSIFLNT